MDTILTDAIASDYKLFAVAIVIISIHCLLCMLCADLHTSPTYTYVCKIIYLSILYAFTSLQAVRRVRPAFGCCINSYFEVLETAQRALGLRYVLTVVDALILHAHAVG